MAELHRRLSELFKEMKDIDQDDQQRDAFLDVAKELISPNLVTHKDKGVKAWTAACLVEILRLCAPEAPFSDGQLKVCAQPVLL